MANAFLLQTNRVECVLKSYKMRYFESMIKESSVPFEERAFLPLHCSLCVLFVRGSNAIEREFR